MQLLPVHDDDTATHRYPFMQGKRSQILYGQPNENNGFITGLKMTTKAINSIQRYVGIQKYIL